MKKLLALLMITSCLNAYVDAPAADTAAPANNPLANMKAFNIHNYYMGELTV